MKLTALIGSGLAAAMLLSACSEDGKAAASEENEASSATSAQTAFAENPLTTWCMETDTREACECADEALRAASMENDYEIYQGMAPTYLKHRAAGDDRVAAFDAASEEAVGRLGMTSGGLREVTNRMGRQHRSAIKQCSS